MAPIVNDPWTDTRMVESVDKFEYDQSAPVLISFAVFVSVLLIFGCVCCKSNKRQNREAGEEEREDDNPNYLSYTSKPSRRRFDDREGGEMEADTRDVLKAERRRRVSQGDPNSRTANASPRTGDKENRRRGCKIRKELVHVVVNKTVTSFTAKSPSPDTKADHQTEKNTTPDPLPDTNKAKMLEAQMERDRQWQLLRLKKEGKLPVKERSREEKALETKDEEQLLVKPKLAHRSDYRETHAQDFRDLKEEHDDKKPNADERPPPATSIRSQQDRIDSQTTIDMASRIQSKTAFVTASRAGPTESMVKNGFWLPPSLRDMRRQRSTTSAVNSKTQKPAEYDKSLSKGADKSVKDVSKNLPAAGPSARHCSIRPPTAGMPSYSARPDSLSRLKISKVEETKKNRKNRRQGVGR